MVDSPEHDIDYSIEYTTEMEEEHLALISEKGAVNAMPIIAQEAIDRGFRISEKVALAGVNEWPITISHVPNPSEEVQLAAVKKDGISLRIIIETHKIWPSRNVQLEAVKQKGEVIKYLMRRLDHSQNTPYITVQRAAVKENQLAILHMLLRTEIKDALGIKHPIGDEENIIEELERAGVFPVKPVTK